MRIKKSHCFLCLMLQTWWEWGMHGGDGGGGGGAEEAEEEGEAEGEAPPSFTAVHCPRREQKPPSFPTLSSFLIPSLKHFSLYYRSHHSKRMISKLIIHSTTTKILQNLIFSLVLRFFKIRICNNFWTFSDLVSPADIFLVHKFKNL